MKSSPFPHNAATCAYKYDGKTVEDGKGRGRSLPPVEEGGGGGAVVGLEASIGLRNVYSARELDYHLPCPTKIGAHMLHHSQHLGIWPWSPNPLTDNDIYSLGE